MNYLFWNTGRKKVNMYLEQLITGLSCDVIALAEYEDDIKQLMRSLSGNNCDIYHVPQLGCQRINILANYKVFTGVKPGPETSYYTMKILPHETLVSHTVVFLHFPSKMYADDEEYLEHTRMLREEIEQLEEHIGNTRTIIVGDFNMNPFEKPMVSAAGMHSMMSMDVALKMIRTVKEKNYSMFYNPMWNLFGDLNKPTGTYYYNSSKLVSYFWNIFDQVIFRPSLLDNFVTSSVRVIESINGLELVGNYGIPNKNISDHLPIFFQVI